MPCVNTIFSMTLMFAEAQKIGENIRMRISRRTLCLLACLAISGCARAPIERAEDAMRLAPEFPELSEVSPMTDFVTNLERNIAHIRATKRVPHFRFGTRVVSRDEYLQSLEYLLEIIRGGSDYATLAAKIRESFDAYEVYGRKEWGEVFITSYFEPMIEGRRQREYGFSQPLYQIPSDLVEVKLRQFDGDFQPFPPTIRGRLTVAEEDGIPSVVPYYSRAEIDSEQYLRGKGLEIAWVDPVESFFLQIQGSGVVRFPDGEEIRVAYAAQNGHAYEALGKFLKHAIPIEEMSLERIEGYLRSLPRHEMQEYLNKNPSYVFFKPARENAITYVGTSAVGLRTIATDAKFFPKGAVAVLAFERPVFQDPTGPIVKEWQKAVHLVIDQDVGGAIKGPDRVDFFWGRGQEAKRSAGVIRQTGRLYYLAPKMELLQKLKENTG